MMENKQIIEALHKSYGECGYVQKKRSEKGGVNYTFAGEQAMIKTLRPILEQNKIIVHVNKIDNIISEQYTTKNGASMHRFIARYEFKFTHISGESIIAVSIGEGADVGDKACAKAATIALKYALRQTLLIETGDDPDNEIVPERAEPVKKLSPKEKMLQWGVGMVAKIEVMPLEELDEWETKQATDLERLKTENPEINLMLREAIGKRRG